MNERVREYLKSFAGKAGWFALLFCNDFTVYAQDSRRAIELDDVEVVSSRLLKDVGVEKTSIDTLILHDNISLSMGDILSKNSTLFIKSYGRATESTAEFRGTSPSHTQVVWNGMRINSPMLGTVDFSTIPAYFIDEANLYHGASSINISGGGLGGAVEMLTKPVVQDGTHLQYVQGVGSFDTYDQFLRLSCRGRKWSSSTRAVYSTSKNEYEYTNYDKKTDVKDEQGNIINSYHPTERNRSGYFDDVHVLQELCYDAGRNNSLRLSVWYNYSKRGLPFLSVDYKDNRDFKNEHEQNNLRSVLSWDFSRGGYKMTVKGGYVYSDVAYHYFTTRDGAQTDITKSQSYTNTYFAKSDVDVFLSDKLMLTAGLSAYRYEVKSHDKSPFHIGDNFNIGRNDADVNVQLRWRPVSALSLAGVVREESHGSKFISPIPALFADVIIYKPWNVVLKSSISRNYRYPSMDDLFFQPGGNPDLRAEKGVAYDAGVEWGVKDKMWSFKGNVTAFDSHISDWILWTPNTKGYWEPSNVKKVHNYGVEAMLSASVMLGRDCKLTASGNYAWTPSKNVGERLNSNDASYGKQLCYVPLRSANMNVRVQWREWTLAYLWNHYSERFTTTSNEVNYITGKLEPYYMSDISLEKQFFCRWFEMSVKGVVNNLFSEEYVTVLSHPMARRNYEIYFTIKI